MAIAEDAAFIRSDGTGNAPRGLRYWAPSGNILSANATINLQNIDRDLGIAILALLNSNVMLDNPGWLFSPRTWNFLATLRDGNGNKAFPEMERGLLRGFPYSTSTQIPSNLGAGTNESEVYFANFADVVIAEDPRFELEASSVAAYHDGSAVQAAFSLDQTVVRVIANHDMIVRHSEAISVLTGVKWGA
jgi:HK97 family phage major capsid protein